MGNKKEVSVVYFRAGYTPNDYKSDTEWAGRRQAELSNAVKCPTVGYQLVGCKIMQAIMASAGVLERYLEPEECERMRSVFAGLWAMDPKLCSEKELDENGMPKILSRVRNDPAEFVMKPQREGGGNNFYGEDIIPFLDGLPQSELPAYLMMERVRPPERDCCLVRDKKCEVASCVSEIGVFSVFLGGAEGMAILNEVAGTLCRTKKIGVTEGGVATGYSCLDSLVMV